MKKIVLSAIFFFACLGFLNAQVTPEKTTAKTAAPVGKMQSKMLKHSNTASDSLKKAGLKKDGTPDMRMKENKMAAKKTSPAGPLKKDSTPDMRYKANKKK